MRALLIATALTLAACGSPFETGPQEREGEGPESGGEPGDGDGGDLSTGGQSSGGHSASGGTVEGSGGMEPGSGGSPEGTGGSLEPPEYPDSCQAFTCGSFTHSGVSDEVYCFTVDGNNSTEGNLRDEAYSSGVGNCLATLDGKEEDFSNGVGDGVLLVWGCDFWFNCF